MADAKAVPENYPQVAPHLCDDGAEAAIDFSCSVLGATERMRLPAPDGQGRARRAAARQL